MHPAYSVIVFTTASGAGYGLLFWLALAAALGTVPADPWLGLGGLGLALALITIGLLSSTAHLGRPERAWRAFSQWRTSWLSREGVAAVATYVPAGLLAIGWGLAGATGGIWSLLAVLAAAMALVTVWCTGMIYQSLPTIRAWSHPLVAPIYVVLALATGAVLAVLVLRLAGVEPDGLDWVAIGLLLLAIALKRQYWASIDGAARTVTPGSATGLGRFGTVRPLEPPHTQANSVMREMGYQVARRHALRLRTLVLAVGFGVPAFAIGLSLLTGSIAAMLLALVAVIAVAVGVVVERWLFFAEAHHIVTAYYTADAA